MAKKSAKSKGYRKTIKKQPFLTKKDIISLAVIVVLIIIGVIVFNFITKMGTIPASKVESGDIIGFASTELRSRYVKLGETTDMEGFTKTDGASKEAPTKAYTYTPDEEGDLTHFNVSSTVYSASRAADVMMGTLASSVDYMSEKMETTFNGREAYVYTINSSYYDETIEAEETQEEADTEEAAAETEQEPNVYFQAITMYIDSDDDHSIAVHAYLYGDDTSFYMPDDQVVDYISNLAAGAIQLPEA